jgi:hypothetical protein
LSDYLIEKILPCNKIHLLAGISSAGKSRFILPSLMMFSAGMPVLGLKSTPVPWSLVCRDRPLSDAQDTIQRMGFALSDVDIIPAFGANSKSYLQIMVEIEKRKSKLILWEGFDLMVKNPNNQREVDEFLGKLCAHCEKGLTVLGTVGVAKLKPHEIYQNPRQLIAGSSIWERITSSNLIIQAVNPKDIEDPRRILYASLKNDPSFAVGGKFNDSGMLVFDGYDFREQGAKLASATNKVAAWEEIY